MWERHFGIIIVFLPFKQEKFSWKNWWGFLGIEDLKQGAGANGSRRRGRGGDTPDRSPTFNLDRTHLSVSERLLQLEDVSTSKTKPNPSCHENDWINLPRWARGRNVLLGPHLLLCTRTFRIFCECCYATLPLILLWCHLSTHRCYIGICNMN